MTRPLSNDFRERVVSRQRVIGLFNLALMSLPIRSVVNLRSIVRPPFVEKSCQTSYLANAASSSAG